MENRVEQLKTLIDNFEKWLIDYPDNKILKYQKERVVNIINDILNKKALNGDKPIFTPPISSELVLLDNNLAYIVNFLSNYPFHKKFVPLTASQQEVIYAQGKLTLHEQSDFDRNFSVGRLINLLNMINEREVLTDEEIKECFIAVCDFSKNSVVQSESLNQKNIIIEREIKYLERWELNLFNVLSNIRNCRIIMSSLESKITVIGKAESIKLCIDNYAILKNELLTLSIKAYDNFLKEVNEDGEVTMPTDHKMKYINNYLAGAVDGVANIGRQRIKILRDDGNDNEISLYFEKNYPNISYVRMERKNSMAGAYNRGNKAGKEINPGINDGSDE